MAVPEVFEAVRTAIIDHMTHCEDRVTTAATPRGDWIGVVARAMDQPGAGGFAGGHAMTISLKAIGAVYLHALEQAENHRQGHRE